MSVDFGRLWNSPHAGVMANKRDIVAFAEKHEAPDGFPKIVVAGIVRRVIWKSIGAGLYHVTTIPDVIEPPKPEPTPEEVIAKAESASVFPNMDPRWQDIRNVIELAKQQAKELEHYRKVGEEAQGN